MKGTIKSKAEIERLFSQGRRYNSRYIVIIAMETEGKRDLIGRVAYIAGKKLGNAPQRNYAKRVMRQIVHEIGLPKNDVNLVFMARKPILEANYRDIEKECKKALGRVIEDMGIR